jgi:hypothetical protein
MKQDHHTSAAPGVRIAARSRARASSRYPETPGGRDPTTSRDAARRVKDRSKVLRARILALLNLEPFGLSANQIADNLRLSATVVTPRLSELRSAGRIKMNFSTRSRATYSSSRVRTNESPSAAPDGATSASFGAKRTSTDRPNRRDRSKMTHCRTANATPEGELGQRSRRAGMIAISASPYRGRGGSRQVCRGGSQVSRSRGEAIEVCARAVKNFDPVLGCPEKARSQDNVGRRKLLPHEIRPAIR